MSRQYRLKLLDRKLVAEQTVVLILEKPKNFIFIPGQYIDVLLPDAGLDDFEAFRTLSIGSVPSDDFLLLAYRNRPSEFKKAVNNLPVGSKVEIQGPFGRFVLYPGKERVYFLAGGIGVVPFLSIIQSATLSKSKRRLYLFYSNSNFKESAFLNELKAQERENPFFKFIPTLTSQDTKDWQGEGGYIDSKMLKKYLTDFKNSLFYIAGTPDMVMDLRFMVTSLGVDPSQIRTESFDGY